MTDNVDNKELAILFPTAQITVGGEEVEVKEYTLKQQLQHNAKFVPFINALRATMGNQQADFSVDELMACLAENYQSVLELVAISINKPIAFVEGLNAREGEDLLLAWWTVNSDFFTRRVVQPIVERKTKDELYKQVQASAQS
ncbi:hypothetical protein A6046_03380 [[Haemophilus] ducreyi]|uniref:Uncharacterized protein n=2 Tax=Haemophilus ducreyi TaxID=730 RepID=Q7VPE8_HAEDU|nr:DUF6631 family protein [[Haemophilus] ducreyi]AAP95133.1 hypothetical protein HD_0137 [[Haemophilus] ducreyi 35000HP]AKO30306.1 hypothetical protein RY60_00530 [[Haemophilus] ducreyi]AKO31739.1 hypothetical protein RZ57_00535 [[Haemophilus] ducreyi]AKO33192.1 hypothetical protein RZ58_00535 [[Haemophilus] ducreyi]AKO34641.1 hypothetical protein RZ59_00530 [[Haemophilus] ducreyi]